MSDSSAPNICAACSRLDRVHQASLLAEEIPRCTAFPTGIPGRIWEGGFDHRNKWPGDNGVRFLLREGGEFDLKFYEDFNSAS
jgi:hypothetical protein